MNQFVPIFLGERKPDVSTWPGAIPGRDTRAADTQKCVRAGGKHNDLEEVGLDAYHHTFFEMLGNWSFGDYFKAEAIRWAWELLTEVWGFPKRRLYATVYRPGPGEPAETDEEALEHWRRIFQEAGLDPDRHVLFGDKKDNFWMMGETGPCGPCSEIHIDLTPEGEAGGALVNAGSPLCIEIWNLVFIQFNANADGSFTPLPARHVDTGMGFERAAAAIQCTGGFRDFSRPVSNYETDVFRPLFARLEELSGKRYGSTLPSGKAGGRPAPRGEQERIDAAFRVIADHIRTLAFAIADGILPGNTDRHYVLRRILRRAVRYGRTLGFRKPFFHKLAGVLADTMGDVFPEVREKQARIEAVIQREEEAFNKTLDRGIELFQEEIQRLEREPATEKRLSGDFVFKLYDTYGFPTDLTELMAREQGFAIDSAGFERRMAEQRDRARKAQKRQAIEVSQIEDAPPTEFVGYETLEAESRVTGVRQLKAGTAVTVEKTPFYAEMGGQVGDSGVILGETGRWRVRDTQQAGGAWLHFLDLPPEGKPPQPGEQVRLQVDRDRREAIMRHHTATHLLHWALHQVLGPEAAQKGSYVGPDKLTFDFNAQPLAPEQLARIEELINRRIVENAPVSWTEAKYEHIRHRRDIRQFFGEKYGEWVRVVQIGGRPQGLDGYSMELCGGVHCRATGQLGLFRIVSESAVAAGIRRIEARAGLSAYQWLREQIGLLERLSEKVGSPPAELERKLENLLARQKELEKQLKSLTERQAAERARELARRAEYFNGVPAVAARVAADGDQIQALLNALKSSFEGVVFLAGESGDSVVLAAGVSPAYTKKVHAGKLVQAAAPLVGGRGGGRPEFARGGGRRKEGIDAALARVREMLAKTA